MGRGGPSGDCAVPPAAGALLLARLPLRILLLLLSCIAAVAVVQHQHHAIAIGHRARTYDRVQRLVWPYSAEQLVIGAVTAATNAAGQVTQQ